MSKHGDFSGEPETRWLTEPNDPDRRMNLLRDFAFTDPEGKAWAVPAGYDKMDGASIPRALWTLVGSPYTGDYRRASIVHDRACDEAHGDKDKRRAADHVLPCLPRGRLQRASGDNPLHRGEDRRRVAGCTVLAPRDS